MKTGRGKRGRPTKFGRRSQVVALTLPEEVVRGLRRIDPDIAWAIVRMFEKDAPRSSGAAASAQPDAELVSVGDGRSLIVVNRATVTRLPGVTIIPLTATRAFLALEPTRGMSDLELAVIDRLEEGVAGPRERSALRRLRAQLWRWRQDRRLRFHLRTIIEVEHIVRRGD